MNIVVAILLGIGSIAFEYYVVIPLVHSMHIVFIVGPRAFWLIYLQGFRSSSWMGKY